MSTNAEFLSVAVFVLFMTIAIALIVLNSFFKSRALLLISILIIPPLVGGTVLLINHLAGG
jgi:hypothetical protein